MTDQTGQTRKVPLYRRIATLLATIVRCEVSASRPGQTAEESTRWRNVRATHAQALVDLCNRYLPRVRASLEDGIALTISGRNRNEIKDYLYEVWRDALTAEVGEWE